jgi:hypothetical protein
LREIKARWVPCLKVLIAGKFHVVEALPRRKGRTEPWFNL